jgi:hypothetical protein
MLGQKKQVSNYLQALVPTEMSIEYTKAWVSDKRGRRKEGSPRN